jgi:hypothetical protein
MALATRYNVTANNAMMVTEDEREIQSAFKPTVAHSTMIHSLHRAQIPRNATHAFM